MTTRSHWAWGHDERRPDAGELGAMVGALLGVSVPSPTEAVPLDRAHVPPSRVELPDDLRAFCTTDREARARHTYGRSLRDQARAFRGDFSPAPDAVALVGDESDVVAVLAWAASEGVAVIPFGGGTSVVGGVEPPGGDRRAISLDLGAMTRLIEVDPVSRSARFEAGATGPAVERQLAAHGLTLRHYPQSFEFSTVGGWIATRAGGHFATLYTHIDELVQGLRVVTPRGVMRTERRPASGAGPSPERLWIGSEGILGVITEAWLRVQPRPRWRESASVRFDTIEHGIEAARAVAQSGLFPANCRLLDPTEARLNMVPADGGAVLLLGFESADAPPSVRLDQAIELATRAGAGTLLRPPTRRDDGPAPVARGGDATAEAWRQSFLDGPYRQSALLAAGVLADTFETCCLWSQFAALHAALEASLARTLTRHPGARGLLSCRFTHVYPDGPAPYYTFLIAGFPGDLLDVWTDAKTAFSDTLREHGVTITHHHAVGRLHRPWYDRERPDLFADALRAAKRSLDPDGLLNPGVLLPETTLTVARWADRAAARYDARHHANASAVCARRVSAQLLRR